MEKSGQIDPPEKTTFKNPSKIRVKPLYSVKCNTHRLGNVLVCLT